MIQHILRRYLKSGMRGGWRLTEALARRLRDLQAVAIETRDFPPVYVDLRLPGMIELFEQSPYDVPPWEFQQQALMRRLVRANDVAYDIGANIGLHTVFLSTLVGAGGRVDAFEANPELYPTLRLTVRGLSNCTLHEYGLSDRDEVGELVVPENREMASLGAWTGSVAARRRCDLRALDGAVSAGEIRPPDFMKCDIEGAELMMLRGARQLVERPNAPIILCEGNAKAAAALGYSSKQIPEFLARAPGASFTIFIEEGPSRWVRRTTFPELNQYVLAVPAARLSRWPGLADADVITIAEDGATALA